MSESNELTEVEKGPEHSDVTMKGRAEQPAEEDTTPEQDESPTNNNVNRDHLDFTYRKVIVYNVLKFLRSKEVYSHVNAWVKDADPSIAIVKAKKPPNGNFVMLTLESEDMVEPLIKLINETQTNKKGKPLFAKRATECGADAGENEYLSSDGRFNNKRGRDEKYQGKTDLKNNNNNKRGRKRGDDPPTPKTPDEIRDAITPLWRIPYEKQLEEKKGEMIKKCAMSIIKEIKTIFR